MFPSCSHQIAKPLMAVAAACNLQVSPSALLQPYVTSSIKPKVHNVAQRRQRRTEPRPHGICIRYFVMIGPAVPEIWPRTDRDRHTDRQTDRQTDWSQYSVPVGVRSIVINPSVCLSVCVSVSVCTRPYLWNLWTDASLKLLADAY